MAKPNFTVERLREVLDYDPATGSFTWKVRTSNRVRVGVVAGVLHSSGYTIIQIDGRPYKAHRLAWLYVHGSWPKHDIDHINGNRADNRIENLRDVRRSVNQENLRTARGKTISGVLGVYASYGKKRIKTWRAMIKSDGGMLHLGRYATKEEAHATYLEAKRRLHEGCTI